MLFNLKGSEFQACGEVEAVAFDGFADVEVMDPAHVKIEVTFTQLRRVGNNRANSEGTPDKSVESVWAFDKRSAPQPEKRSKKIWDALKKWPS